MKYLFETATRNTNFIFNNKIYLQINGVTMSLPLELGFAEVDVNYFEGKIRVKIKK